MTPSPSVLIVSTHATLAASLEARLRGSREWRLAVGTPSHLSRLVEEYRPDIVVLAEEPPRLTRILESLRDDPAAPAVVLVLADPRGAWTAQARRAGVRAVLPSDATAEELTVALLGVGRGLIVLHPEAFGAASTATRVESQVEGDLTARELEIVDMMAEGLSNRLIARRLGISRHTVKFHVASILGKLRASSRTEAVMIAVRRGLVSV